MNLVVNDLDMPLIIKVASTKERMGLLFIDNWWIFQRKTICRWELMYPDNDERDISAKSCWNC
jgi:starch synthase